MKNILKRKKPEDIVNEGFKKINQKKKDKEQYVDRMSLSDVSQGIDTSSLPEDRNKPQYKVKHYNLHYKTRSALNVLQSSIWIKIIVLATLINAMLNLILCLSTFGMMFHILNIFGDILALTLTFYFERFIDPRVFWTEGIASKNSESKNAINYSLSNSFRMWIYGFSKEVVYYPKMLLITAFITATMGAILSCFWIYGLSVIALPILLFYVVCAIANQNLQNSLVSINAMQAIVASIWCVLALITPFSAQPLDFSVLIFMFMLNDVHYMFKHLKIYRPRKRKN